MAEIFIKEQDEGYDFRHIQGQLRILLFFLDDAKENGNIVFQPFPNNEGREAGLKIKLQELRSVLETSHDFDQVVPWLLQAERDGIQSSAPGDRLVLGDVDALKMAKHESGIKNTKQIGAADEPKDCQELKEKHLPIR